MPPGPAVQVQTSGPEPFHRWEQGSLLFLEVERIGPLSQNTLTGPPPALCQKFFYSIIGPSDSLLGDQLRPLQVWSSAE